MTGRPQRNAAALKPGLIILLGVVAIALVLITILLLPPPNIRSAAQRLIPPGTTIVSELNYGDLIGMSGSTDASLSDVAEFYRKRFRLGRGRIGVSAFWDGGLFGRFRSGVTMTYTTEGFVILVRERSELLAVAASRATNENRTSIEVFCERKRARQEATGVNRATRFGPPNATAGGSAWSLLTGGATFTTPSALTSVTPYYLTNVLHASSPSPSTSGVSRAGSGMVSIPKRTGGASATFLVRTNVREAVLIHCFRSATSTQTHVLVGCASR